MIHSVSDNVLSRATIEDFQQGHFYMIVERIKEAYPGYKGFNIAGRLLTRFPGQFKTVYTSRPFMNSVHGEEYKPYLVVIVLEKL